MSFVHTHLHTDHSRLDGLASVDEVVKRAVLLEQPAVAITDHGVCSGHLQLQHATDLAGIKPIFGMEGYFADSRWIREGKKGEFYSHMVVMALNNKGLENLWTLSSLAFIDGLYYGNPRFDWELLDKYNEGLAITSGCMGGCIGSLLNPEHVNLELAEERLGRFLNIFKDRFYMEVHTYRSPEQQQTNLSVVEMAQRYSIPMLAVSDSHYLKPEDWYLHEAVTTMGLKKTMDDPTRIQHGENQLAMYSEAEVRERLSYLPENVVDEAIANTVALSDRVSARIEEKIQVPVFFSSEDEDKKILKEMAAEGFQERILDRLPAEVHKEYWDRLQYELEMILEKNFQGYFLMVRDTVGWSKAHGLLMGPARGSAGGSLLAYVLRITEVDPIEYGLLFERFLDLERVSMPDIDLDFPDSERSLPRAYLEDRYGSTNIATIGTFDMVGIKSAIRGLCKVFKVSIPDTDQILELAEQLDESTVDVINSKYAIDFQQWIAKYPLVFEYLPMYYGHIHHSSSHAAGVIISKESLMGKVPLYVSSPGDTELKIQFDMKDVESLGFIKIDHLGIRNLSTLMRAYKMVKERHPNDNLPYFYDWGDANLYEDQAVWDSIATGNNLGVFQIESSGLRQQASRFRPQSIEDLGAMIAAYRPGLLDAKDPETKLSMFELYMRRKEHRLKTKYPHPLLEGLLEPTYGTFLYQEQVMKGVQIIAGYTLKDANRMRKIIGKKLPEEMKKERSIFIAGAMKTNGLSHAEADTLFDELEAHQRYSFNKSHSIGYALIAYWCAYMKHYFPHEYMTALLQTDDDSNITETTRECARLGITILGPDINHSKVDFSLDENNNIVFGFKRIKWGPSSNELERLQPYASIEDFVARTTKQIVNKRSVEVLAMTGALDSIVTDPDPAFSLQKNALLQFWNARDDGKKYFKQHKGTCPLCGGTKTEFECWADEEDLDNKAKHELELLSLILSSDPLKNYIDVIAEESTYKPGETYFRNERTKVGGLIIKADKNIKIKNGKNKGRLMGRVLVQTAAYEDVPSDTLEVVVFPNEYDALKDKLDVGAPVFTMLSKLESGWAMKDLLVLQQGV